MKVAVYDLTAVQFVRSLHVLKGLLAKAAQFADQRKFPASVLLGSRLAPDQFPLSTQIQIACDNAKLCVARLSGVEAPKHEDNEQTLDQFIARIDSTIAFLESVKPESFAGFADKTVRFHWNPGAHLRGEDYLVQFALPNFYFHLTTAYSILRNNGLELGKADYTGTLTWQKD